MAEIVEALYDFQPQSEGDVEIHAGQQIEVYEHLSADWLRGKNLDTGSEGVLPANYVRPAEKKRSFSRPPAPAPQGHDHSDYPQPYSEKEQYQPPPPTWGQQQYQPPQYQQYQPPQQYEPPQQQYQPPQQIMMPPEPQQQAEHHRHHGQFGNLARRFGDSVMFGAGATLGGDIINKIF